MSVGRQTYESYTLDHHTEMRTKEGVVMKDNFLAGIVQTR